MPKNTPSAPEPQPPTADYRSGFIGIIGKTNVGKSTLLNRFLGHKVSITSPRAQTTRYRVLGILTRPDAQAMFIDSPGWHKPEHPLGQYLLRVAQHVVDEVDILLVVIDAVSGIRTEDEWVFEHVRQAKRPAILAVNKVDAVKKPMLLPLLERCEETKLFQELVPISAKEGENVDPLLELLISRLPLGPRWYEADQITDQTTEQMIRELIREQALLATRQEVPHAMAVLVDQVEEKDRVTVIHATILVERPGQKAIIIGKRGAMLKQIGQASRLEIERWLGRRVYLQLWVKVVEGWRQKSTILKELGYEA